MSFDVGKLVRISGLKGKPELNGSLGVVVGAAPDSNDRSVVRNKVMLGKGNTTISLKVCNLEEAVFDEAAKVHEVALFWPPARSDSRWDTVNVAPIAGWPEDFTQETSFMKKHLEWKDPQVLGGLESFGDAKPNYMMYYDAQDTDSFVNHFANKIALGPDVQRYWDYKVPKPAGSGDYRGACIIRAPKNTFADEEDHEDVDYSDDGDNEDVKEDEVDDELNNTGAKRSLKQLMGVVEFYHKAAFAKNFLATHFGFDFSR